MGRFLARPWCALLAATLSGAAGCSVRNPYVYNTPPTALAEEPLASLDPYNRVVVVGEFENPPRTNVPWSDIGVGMSGVLSQAMLNKGNFDVWSNERLAKSVKEILEGPTTDRPELLGRQYEKHQNVRFVVTGKVTDFHHTNEVERDLRRSKLFGSKREAIVAFQFTMVDLEARRVLVADHVFGTSKAGRKATKRIYDDISFGSYLFWNSPLGRATESAVDKAMARISAVVPTTVKPLRIVRQASPRKVEVRGDSSGVLAAGQDFYVYRYDEREARYTAIRDPHTDLPLRARILEGGRELATAWLLGEKPPEVDLRGAELRWDAPLPDDPVPYVEVVEPPVDAAKP